MVCIKGCKHISVKPSELVAAGVVGHTIRIGENSATKRMVIMK